MQLIHTKGSGGRFVRLACLALVVAAGTAWGGTVTSQVSGYWANPATWGGSVPGSGDDVTIVAGHTVTLTNLIAVSVNSLSVSGVLTHAANTTFRHRVNLQVTTDLMVAAGGSINVDLRGYPKATGPGTCWGATQRRSGASHGGKGAQGSSTDSYPGETYGSVIAPTNLGSGGSTYSLTSIGGGAVLLSVGGTTLVEGLITANGGNASTNANSGGSGGSVYLTTLNLLGTGLIRANGAPGWNISSSSGGGGGGRIAVVLTGASSFDSVTFQAFGGTNDASASLAGAAGTVYLRTQGQGANEGTLIIANNGWNGNRTTEISANVTDAVVGDVIIRDSGTLLLKTNQALTVNGSFSNGFAFVAQLGSTLHFGGTATATVYGSQSLAKLVCTNAAKTMLFQAGKTNTVEEGLTLTGDGTAKLLLRSATDGSQWKLSVKNTAIQVVDYVDVKDSKADVGYATQVTATHSTNSGNTINWSFVEADLTNTWTGVSNSTWNVAANWDLGRAPIASDAMVVIAGGCPHSPLLDTDRELARLTLLSGSALGLNGHDLTVLGEAVIGGALTATGTESVTFGGDTDVTGTLTLVGSETVTFLGNVDFTGGSMVAAQSTVLIGGTLAQSVTSAGEAFYQLTVTNAAALVTFTDAVRVIHYRSESASVSYGANLDAGDFRVYSTGGAVTQTFAAGATYRMDELYLMGSVGKTQVLRSAGVGTWGLSVSNIVYVKCVDVEKSDASGGRVIHALTSTDGGGNTGWVFDADWKVWTGTANVSFTNGANWSPVGVPTATSFVLIDDPHLVRLSSPVTVYRLMVGGSTSALVEVNARLTVQEDAQVMSGGVLTHANNGTVAAYKLDMVVTGSLSVLTGGRIDVDAKGYQAVSGPGATIDTGSAYGAKRCGASYGGKGALGEDSLPGETYGSCLMPTNLGSGGSGLCVSSGGGAVQLSVGAVTRIDGLISANGTNENVSANGGGSGGGIYLTTSNLVGTGTIRANGAPAWINNGLSGAGGGGRVAVILTGTESWGSVVIQAFGGLNGNYSGGAGTIYRETPLQSGGRGTVTINNNGMTVNGYAELPGVLSPALSNELAEAVLVLTNTNTRLALTTNAVVGNLLITTSASLVLGGHFLSVDKQEHPLDSLTGSGPGATNRVDHYAQILWAPRVVGTVFRLR